MEDGQDQEYDETKTLVQSVSVKLFSRSLATRLEAVEVSDENITQSSCMLHGHNHLLFCY